MERKISKTEAEWQAQLTSEQYRICRERGTEPPFTGAYHDCKTPGIYRCACCGTALFSSESKFDSGTGWPSFMQPVHADNIQSQPDYSLFMHRVEVLCNVCGAHLGHVFDDGPAPTYQRYCINSASLLLDTNSNK